MKRVYVTVSKRVQREQPTPEEGRSSLVVLDWEAQSVVSRDWIELVEGPYRGRSRGCSGMVFHDGMLCVAVSPNVVQRRDPETLAVVSEFAFEGVLDIHQIQSYGGLLWVVDSRHNALVGVKGEKVVARCTALTDQVLPFVHTWRHGDVECEDKIHFNSVEWAPNSREIHVYADCNMVYDASAKRPLWLGHPLYKPHDVSFVSAHELVVNSSAIRSTYLLNLLDSTFRELYRDESQVEFAPDPAPYCLAGWTRGLAVHRGSAFVGVAPGAVVELDVKHGGIRRRVNFSDDPRDAPYSVVLDPKDWK